MLAGLLHVAHTLPRDPAAQGPVHLASLLWLAERAKDWLLTHLTGLAEGSTEMRRAVIELDLGLTVVIGCLRDGVPSRGFGAIDDEDARAWFRRHGAAPATVDSTPVRALYDLYLAYEGGDQSRPALAAGVAINAVLRLALDYKGAVVNEMRGGMGEVVIAPIYEVLARRGVKFAFFHRVEKLELTPDRKRVARIRLARQVDLVDGTTTGYRPLVDVDGLPCWPSEPLADQVRDAGRLAGVDLESRWSGWTDVDHPVLEDGRDFDVAVLGISLGGLHDIAADFRADDRWRDLLDKCGTTQSASAQLWFDRSLAELGWTRGAVPADAAPGAARRLGRPVRGPAPRAVAGSGPEVPPVPVRRDPRRRLPPTAERHRRARGRAGERGGDHGRLAGRRRDRDLARDAIGRRRVRLEPAPRSGRRHRSGSASPPSTCGRTSTRPSATSWPCPGRRSIASPPTGPATPT